MYRLKIVNHVKSQKIERYERAIQIKILENITKKKNFNLNGKRPRGRLNKP